MRVKARIGYADHRNANEFVELRSGEVEIPDDALRCVIVTPIISDKTGYGIDGIQVISQAVYDMIVSALGDTPGKEGARSRPLTSPDA